MTTMAVAADRRLNPWFTMWTQPRETVRQIVKEDPEHLTAVLAALAGIANVLNRASARDLGDRAPVALILILAIGLGAAAGIIGLKLGALLIEWTGERIGGRADRTQISAALAWGGVPAAWSLAVWAVMLLVARGDVFTTETPHLDANPALALIMLPLLLVWLVMMIWQPFVTCKALGEVQGFSAWRALGNIALAGLVVLVPFVALGVLVGGAAFVFA